MHVLLGLVLASWSLVVAVPFSESPQLAAVVATFLAVVLAILGMVVDTANSLVLVFFSLLFPPAWYIFALKAVCGFENHRMAADVLRADPDRGILIAPLIVVAIVRFLDALRMLVDCELTIFVLFC
jgi:ATP-binding cassette subfamily A (ABC1) protein 3